MNIDQLNHYKTRLAFEADSWDLYEAMSLRVKAGWGVERTYRNPRVQTIWLVRRRRKPEE